MALASSGAAGGDGKVRRPPVAGRSAGRLGFPDGGGERGESSAGQHGVVVAFNHEGGPGSEQGAVVDTAAMAVWRQ